MDGIPSRGECNDPAAGRFSAAGRYLARGARVTAKLALAVGLVLSLAGLAAAAESSEQRLERARELSWSGDYARSLALYRDLLAERPDDPSLHRERGLVLLWAGRESDAIGEFEWVLERNPEDAEIRLALGRAHYYLGESAPAVEHYLSALPSFEEDAAVIAEAVAVMRAAAREALAEHWLEHGLEMHPGDPDLRVARAAAWISEGELDDAEGELEAVLAEHPGHAGARSELTRLREERDAPVALAKRLGYSGRYRKAKQILRAHLRDHPDDDEATWTLARFSGWTADYSESQALFRNLLRDRPDDRRLRTELAEVTSWRGQYDEASRMFAGLIAEEPGDMRPRLGMANIQLWNGVYRMANRDLRQILAEEPGHEEAAKQLRVLDELRAPSLEPRLLWFRDSEGFTLWSSETEFRYSPRPGRTLSIRLDVPRAEGQVVLGYDPETGDAILDSKRETGFGLRFRFTRRPDRRYQLGGEVGAVHYRSVGFSPRGRAWISFWPSYRHVLQLDLRHEDALPEMRSIQSVLEGIERSTLYLVHMYQGERFTSWTRLELGHFSDDPNFWTARTVLGYSLLKRPFELDVLGIATAGDFSEQSPYYYSPERLSAYGAGIRLKKKFGERLDLLLLAEKGKIRSDGASGDTLRIAPELKWKIRRGLELSLRYDRYESIRRGAVYESELASASLHFRWPVRRP